MLKVKQVTVTPSLAKKLLANNEGNRNVRTRTVDKYAGDMTEGLWLETGEPLQVTLLNGQHRGGGRFDVDDAIDFGRQYKTDRARLVAIMKNIIENEGTFVP